MRSRTVVVLLLMVGIVSCGYFPNEKEQRARRAAELKGNIQIGAVAPWAKIANLGYYRQGIEMAADEINAAGGILGKKLDLIERDDEGSVSRGRIIAQEFATNLDMVAVLGHYNSHVSIPCSLVYEYYGLLMFSPASTSNRLTEREGFKLVFRNVETDRKIGARMAEFSRKHKFERLMILYSKDDYGRGLADAFEEKVEELGCSVQDRCGYDVSSNPKNYRREFRTWKEDYAFDAVFIAGSMPDAAGFIVMLRQMGINVPIFGEASLDTPRLWEIGGDAAEGTIVASYFNPGDPDPVVRRFAENFEKRYAVLPDVWAAQGYDALKVLAFAMEQGRSAAPSKVADALRGIGNWKGVTGDHAFNRRGDVTEKHIVFKVVRGKKFEYIDE